MCWGTRERNSLESHVPIRTSQSHRPRLNPTLPHSLRVSSPRVSISQEPATPLSSLEVSAPRLPLRASAAPVRVKHHSSAEQPFGLKVLASGTNPVADLVAVHGLDGHWEGTWTAENGSLWLRDYLPGVVPNIRILTFGYDGRTYGSTPLSQQTLHDHAISLVTDLCLFRQGKHIKERPIIFVAHSIGGIIVKDALIHSNSANTRNLEHHNAIKTSTYGILFFGTPHQGADGLTLKRIFLNAASLFTNTNSNILQNLEEGSGQLLKQLGQYNHISKDFDTKFFYETYPPPSGTSIVVPISSAVVPGATDTEVFAINSDHERLVKYTSADDRGFQVASRCITLMVEEAPTKVMENWRKCKRVKGKFIHAIPRPSLIYNALLHKSSVRVIRRDVLGTDGIFNIAAEMNEMQITFDIPFELDYRRNPDFTGRRHLLDNLQNEIKNNKSTLVTIILHGVGGIGKTDIALEYAYAHQKEYTSIFWINAASEATALAGYRGIAQRLIKQHAKIAHDAKPNYLLIAKNLDMIGVVDENGRISHEKEHSARMVQGVKLWFTKDGNQKWLLVIDNVDDLDSFGVQNYVPSAPHASGTIIMTSRRPECARFGKGIEVKEMLESEGVGLLLKSARLDSDMASPEEYLAAAEVARKLGYLPLSIVQAGAYVAGRKISFRSYLGIYETFFNKVFSERPPNAVWSYGDRTALTTWEISYQAIKEENEEAAELLSLCSFLSNENIREDMLYRGKKLQEDVDITIDHSMILLFSYSLAQRKESNSSFYIHPVVHLWARERLEEKVRIERMKEAIILVGNAVEYFGREKVDYWEYGSELMVHIDLIGTNIEKYLKGDLNDTALIEGVRRIAEVDSKLGRFEAAEGLQLLVMEATQRMLGKEHPDTLRAMTDLASTYWDESRFKEAEDIQVQVMNASKTARGKEHQDTLTVMTHLAGTYWDQGRQKEAETLLLQVVEANLRVLGDEHPDTLISLSNLSKTYRNQGRWKEAERIQLRVMETRQKVLQGKEHPETVESMAALALIYYSQGRLKAAERMQLQVLEASQRVLGKEHPDTMTAMANLASTYRDQRRLKDAEDLELQVVETSQRLLGNEHSKTIIAVSNLAVTYSQQGRLEEAEEIKLQVLEMMESVLGKEHPNTLAAMSNLASSYYQQGRLDKAEKLELQALELKQRVLGKDDLDTLISMANLASTYYQQERLTESEELELQILEAKKRILGDEHLETMMAVSNLASTYSSQGRLKAAEEMQLQVLEVRERVLGKDHPETLKAMGDLASTYYSQERLIEAEELGVQVVEARKRVLGEEHADTMTAMVNLGSIYWGRGQSEKSEELELQVVEVRRRELGTDHPDTLTAMANLAFTYCDLKRFKEAEEMEMQVLEARQKVLGQDHPDTITAMKNLASTYRDQERVEEAQLLEMKIEEARQRAPQEDHSSASNNSKRSGG